MMIPDKPNCIHPFAEEQTESKEGESCASFLNELQCGYYDVRSIRMKNENP